MFIPLHDANALVHIRLQIVTLALIAVNVLVYLGVNIAVGDDALQAMAISFGYIPAVVNDFNDLPVDAVFINENLSLISYAFLHSDFMHLAGNMLFLWVFGDNVEDAMGHVKFLIFYLLCAVAGGLAHGLIDTSSTAPLIGASGAVAGIIGAYLMLHPKMWVWVLAFGRIPLRLPAFIPLLLWICVQMFMIVADPDGAVSWGAHIGGFFAGVFLVLIFRRKGVPLFDRELVTPNAVELQPKTSAASTAEQMWGRASD